MDQSRRKVAFCKGKTKVIAYFFTVSCLFLSFLFCWSRPSFSIAASPPFSPYSYPILYLVIFRLVSLWPYFCSFLFATIVCVVLCVCFLLSICIIVLWISDSFIDCWQIIPSFPLSLSCHCQSFLFRTFFMSLIYRGISTFRICFLIMFSDFCDFTFWWSWKEIEIVTLRCALELTG